MRDFKGMKRQRGRNRGSGGNSGKPQHNTNRAFDSNGPDGVKVRGAAQSVYEKYQQLARDAHTSGDRVLAENYLQHAEHYFRVMRAMQPLRPISEIIGRDQFVSGYDIDFEDESGQAEAVESDGGESQTSEGAEQGERFEGRRDDRQRDDRQRDDYRPREDYRPRDEQRYSDTRQRDERPRDDRYQGDRSQNERSQNDRSQNDRTNDRGQNDRTQGDRNQGDRTQSDRSQPERYASDHPAADRQSSDRQNSDRPQSERSNRSYRSDRPRYERDERPRADTAEVMPVVEPEATPLPVERPASVLRADDGDVSHAPAFLQVRPSEPRAEGAPAVRKAPRRRTPRAFENAEVAGAEAPAKSDAEEG